jgi:hypothetical protein
MFTRFFSAIRVAYVVNLISLRHTLKQEVDFKYRHPVENTLFNTLSSSSSGVFVHWGVYESGKTTAVRDAAWRLQDRGGRLVICVSGYDFSGWRGLTRGEWFRKAIGIPDDSHEPLSDFFTKQATTIIIDNADSLMNDDARASDTVDFVKALATESAMTGRFNVLLVLTSWERAKELLDTGCKLVPDDLPARWTGDQLDALFTTLPADMISSVGDRKDELLRLSTLSGTPGFMTFEAWNANFESRHAVVHDLEWRKGTKVLYDKDLQPYEGRFPDKYGIFHHEDLRSPDTLSAVCEDVC